MKYKDRWKIKVIPLSENLSAKFQKNSAYFLNLAAIMGIHNFDEILPRISREYFISTVLNMRN